jgi:hypothetical protein
MTSLISITSQPRATAAMRGENQTSEAVVFPGTMELTVGGNTQFSGTFSGTDENAILIENGSFKFDHPA